MKKFLNKVLVVLTMTAAIVANVNAMTQPATVKSTVNAVVTSLAGPASAAGRAQEESNLRKLDMYAQDYPAIKADVAQLRQAAQQNKVAQRKLSAARGGAAYNAQQNINAILASTSMSQPMTTVTTSPRGRSVSRTMAQAPVVTPALVNKQAKEVNQAVANVKLAEQKVISAKTGIAKENAQRNVNAKKEIAAATLEELQDSAAQLNQPVIIGLAVNLQELKDQKALAPNMEDKKAIDGEMTTTTAQMSKEEKAQGLKGYARAAVNYALTCKNAFIVLGVGVAGTAAAYGAYKMGYLPSGEDMKATTSNLYANAPSLSTWDRPTSNQYAAVATGVVATGAAAYGANRFRKGEEAVTPDDLSKEATGLKTTETQLDNAQVTADKLRTQKNMDKVEDLKEKVNTKSINTINKLEGLRNWNGDLKGYTKEQVDNATENLKTLYKTEDDLKKELKEVTNEGRIYNSPKADKLEQHKAFTTALRQVQLQIKDNEVIAGKRRSNATKTAIVALIGAAALGAAAADHYLNEGKMMSAAVGYGSAALATGAGYAQTARGYVSSGASKVYQNLPDVRGRLNSAYQNSPDVRGRLNSAYQNAPDVRGRLSSAYQNAPDVRSRLNSAYQNAPDVRGRLSRMYYGTPSTTPQVVPTSTGETFGQMATRKSQEAAVGLAATEALRRGANRGQQYLNPEETMFE